MSDSHKTFVSKITDLFVSKNIHEVLNDLNWKLVVMKETNELKQNCTWDIVELSTDKKIVGCKWMLLLNVKLMVVLKDKTKLVEGIYLGLWS